jgi:hypothetical protein
LRVTLPQDQLMAIYRLNGVYSISNGSGHEHVQLTGPGWTEAAQKVAQHISAGAHRFVAEIDGTLFWLQLGAGADGARTMLAKASTGTVLTLDELAARLPGAQPVRQPQRLPARDQSWWQRLFPKIRSTATA